MKKRSFGLVLLLAILVIVIAFYLVATTIAKREEENDDPVIQDTTIIHINKKASDVTAMTYRSESYDFTIDVAVNGKFTLASDSAFPLNQTIASYMAEAVAVIAFDQKLNPEGNDLTEYGLHEPQTVLSVTYKDGAKVHLEIGNYNKYTDSFYCQIGDGFVYLMDGKPLEYFKYSITDLLQDEVITTPQNGFSSLTQVELLYANGNRLVYDYVKAEADVEGSEDRWTKTANEAVAEGDFTSDVQTLYNELYKISLDEWAAYNVTGNDSLAAYGLDTPAIQVIFHYIEKTTIAGGEGSSSSITKEHERAFGFFIGSTLPNAEDTSDTESDTTEAFRYFLLEGGSTVYIVSEKNLAHTLSLT